MPVRFSFQVLLFCCGLLSLSLWAAPPATPLPASAAYPEPRELVRLAVANDLRQAREFTPYSFQFRKQTPSDSRSEVLVGTKDGFAGRTIAINDQPLTQLQSQEEDTRLKTLLQDPSRLSEKLAKQKENHDRSVQIVAAMPQAFLFEYDGTESRTIPGQPAESLLRLKFRPDPKYAPPTRIEQVLTTMSGTMLIEPRLLHLARIDGTLQSDVAFGWGILGHLDKGGRILLEQNDIGNGVWQQTHMILNFSGKLLIFKNIDIKIDQTQKDFQRVADNLTFAQGVDWLNQRIAGK